MAEHEDVTLGEVYRLLLDLSKRLQQHTQDSMTIRLWEVEKRSFEDKMAGQGREIGELKSDIKSIKAAKESEHDLLEQKITSVQEAGKVEISALKEANLVKEDELRKERAKTWLSISLAILSIVGSIIAGITVGTLT